MIKTQKYTCDCCHYFFYLNDQSDDYPTNCPYCSCEIVPTGIVDFEIPDNTKAVNA